MDEEWGEGGKEGEREKLRKFVLHDSLSLAYPHMIFPPSLGDGGGNEEIFSRALPPPPPPTLSPKGIKKFNCIPIRRRGRVGTRSRKEVLSRTAILSTPPHAGRLVGLFLHFFVLPPTSNYP